MNPAPTADFRRLTAVGPYFALDTPASADDTPPPGYRPLRELYDGGPDGPLAARVHVVAQRLATAELRVAASILHLGLAARFWSVGVGAAVLLGAVPPLDEAWMRIPDQGPIDLWTPQGRPTVGTLPRQLHHVIVEGQLEPLAEAVRAVVPLSARLLLGNSASALAGTLRVLDGHAPDTARTLVAEVLGRPPFADTGALHTGADGTGAHGTAFRRRSCCLYYRVGPGAGVCGDCCFTRPPAVRNP
ncbi:(2Fe-2S)-binding protein [Streptomyces sp. SP17BM10]|uniref:(2Fe-2S)-binding protein n=1 Tax=Streptomyces sp. SP17BM10 TaxID=3002530 RepID=UPI002E784A1E|nr:(2Fe-2S)-binding protein [Streptomyces sp. SP17BM10]MEE1782019.1 (2Fe-2S)-binding protein [Streptomyces sp. SP17BM10]